MSPAPTTVGVLCEVISDVQGLLGIAAGRGLDEAPHEMLQLLALGVDLRLLLEGFVTRSGGSLLGLLGLACLPQLTSPLLLSEAGLLLLLCHALPLGLLPQRSLLRLLPLQALLHLDELMLVAEVDDVVPLLRRAADPASAAIQVAVALDRHERHWAIVRGFELQAVDRCERAGRNAADVPAGEQVRLLQLRGFQDAVLTVDIPGHRLARCVRPLLGARLG
mmetsp:Transcript_78905/g.205082  ORF Transcript_78905/g.205082 Transcript_78905/m.205082 type:complete len:221 (-) Transcript_78905:928-1590(-)